MKDRLEKVMRREGMTAAQFAEKIGISASSLSNILRGRNDISLSVIMKVKEAFEDITLDWLIYGIGEMESSPSPQSTDETMPLMDFSGDENPLFADNWSDERENRKEMALKTPVFDHKEPVIEKIKYVEKPDKKITEIRIFFDNGTYETFRPEK